jgi:hypothetical protein
MSSSAMAGSGTLTVGNSALFLLRRAMGPGRLATQRQHRAIAAMRSRSLHSPRGVDMSLVTRQLVC